MKENKHGMTIFQEHEGTQIWKCDICNREVSVEWIPKFRKKEIVAGNTSVFHGGMTIDLSKLIK